MITKLDFPEAQEIVGIATESGRGPASGSEDFVYYDARSWTAEEDEEARENQSKHG